MTTQSKTIWIIGAVALLLLLPAGHASAAELVAKFEGFRSVPYWDVNGWAVGYGSHYNYDAGRAVRQSDRITQQTALKWLKMRLDEDTRFLYSVVDVPINTNQRDSLLSLIYNIGSGNFANSTLLSKLNSRRPKSEVAAEFDKWVKAGGVVNPVLQERRRKEKQLFLS